ncbi:MAG: hypothetical protein PUF03_01375 [Lachnospiraceae bacterium]|nr:hypothetical protein [Lachnospiraceae bacterium]
MKCICDRKEEIMKYIQPCMEQYFMESCQRIQRETEENGAEVWQELKDILRDLLQKIRIMQEQNEKGEIQYFIFNFMESGVYTDKIEIYIDALDDGFYLDEQEAVCSYCPCFLQKLYQRDIEGLVRQIQKQFIRLQEYEIVEVKRKYIELYDRIMYEMIKSLSELVMREITGSGIKTAGMLKIAYGRYMDKAVIVYAKEKG